MEKLPDHRVAEPVEKKAYSIINVAGQAIGMGCCALIFMFVQNELSCDDYHLTNGAGSVR